VGASRRFKGDADQSGHCGGGFRSVGNKMATEGTGMNCAVRWDEGKNQE